NPEVAKLGWGIMIFYIGTGLLFGITTLMDNGTELALGMHAANNIVAALFVSNDWAAFRTDALFLDTSEPTLGMDTFLPVFVLYPIILLVFSKKYGWYSWQQRLMGRVEAPDPVA
ncbi:MAG: CPBP family intramembrane metalloprotease domain-containing protein, partial [Flavobacteriaceae bacterium]|nr:CPBP family intramembrane metalloprotease domain-containing protein [Flavobacteriaceae bacterium]